MIWFRLVVWASSPCIIMKCYIVVRQRVVVLTFGIMSSFWILKASNFKPQMCLCTWSKHSAIFTCSSWRSNPVFLLLDASWFIDVLRSERRAQHVHLSVSKFVFQLTSMPPHCQRDPTSSHFSSSLVQRVRWKRKRNDEGGRTQRWLCKVPTSAVIEGISASLKACGQRPACPSSQQGVWS